jgi:hypothetical protein
MGFDVLLLKNIDGAIRERERERQQAYLRSIEELRVSRQNSNGCRSSTTPDREPLRVPRDQLMAAASAMIQEVDSILDIGCAFRPQTIVNARFHICCEPCSEYLDRLIVETSEVGKYIYLKCDLEETTRLFPAASVDSVFLVDVIEHLERGAAVECLTRLKSIARWQIVLFTPMGFMPQESREDGLDPWGMKGAAWQQHRSGWHAEDFPAAEGWRVVECGDFHTCDGYGRPLNQPVGAMWAIWTRS